MIILDIDSLIKFIAINFCVCYSFFKAINYKNLSKVKKINTVIISITLAFLQCILQSCTPLPLRIFLIYFILSIFLGELSKLKFGNSILVTTISLALSYIANFISIWIILLFIKFNPMNIILNDTIAMFCSSCINILLVFTLFKIKRFKNGFPFIKSTSKNENFDIFILAINIIIMFMYFLFGYIHNISILYFIAGFIMFVLILMVIIQETFMIYHKQKLQTKALKDYEQELSETKQKLATALEEKQKLVKSNHEFYHRQAALNKKLDDLRNQNQLISDTEFAEEYSNILNRINNLSAEYDSKTYTIPNLTKTNIIEIDDMLLYMQSECVKNNIEFIFKLECDINYIIENFISKSQLETLLGDLIRNAIIAINYSSNNFKSIMIVLGIKDESYELSIFDSGIEFEIETLLNLGIQPASTHLNDGGTGIGFITTFETIHSCNASFIINEITNNNYTKSLEIRFDNKNEYIIISNRKEKINEMNKSNRDIILK